MTLQELKAAFPSMPEESQRALQKTLDGLPVKGPARKRKGRLVPLLAALLALAIFVTALAALGDKLLVYLLGAQADASLELREMAQELDVSGTADGVTITLTGAIFDGERLAFSFEAQTEDASRLAAVALDYTYAADVKINGDFTSTASHSNPMWVPSLRLDILPVTRNPTPGGMTCDLSTPFDREMITCTAVFDILRPKGPVAVVDGRMLEDLDELDAQTRAEREDQRNVIYGIEDVTVAQEGQLSARQWAERGYTVITQDGEIYQEEEGETDGAYLYEGTDPFDALEKTGEVELRFTVHMKKARDIAPKESIGFTDCTVRFERFSLSPLSTHIAFELLPIENTQEAAEQLRTTYGFIEAMDGEGQALDYHDMDFMCDGQGRVVEREGQWACRYDIDMPGLYSTPQIIWLQARTNFDGDAPSTPEQAQRIAAFNERMRFPLE